ncbi:MAG TPA: hypothetical protein VGF40_14105 [Thermoanaerobaculia bacterium]
MDGRTDELIQMRIDGEISSADLAELDAALAADREARASMESFHALARELDAMPRVDPPALFASKVLRQVRGAPPMRAAAPPPAPATRRRIALVGAWAAAAGLLLGLLAGPLLMRADLFRADGLPASVAGAMGTAEIASWELLSRQRAATPGGSLVLTARRDDGRYAVEVSCAGIGSTAELSWDPARLSLLALVREHASGPIEATPGRVRARIASGERLTLVLSGGGEPGSVHLGIDGVRLLSSDLSLDGGRK